ncbi:MAG TPA: carbon-nitrogen hydrolase family protein [Candidatus Limnocylindrales bacterium]|nr:carbon-nitrogen hydrolase family protein [Candidatus Limnocylindrales bacterium]
MPRRTRQDDHPHRVAIVQRPPVLLDRAATLKRAAEAVAEAAAAGAHLALFAEAYVPGYPEWIWRLRPADDGRLVGELHARLLAEAVDLEAGGLGRLQQAAARHHLTVAIGVQELDARYSRATLFSTFVIIGPDGTILRRHRKLMPTNPERMVWGLGDGADLEPAETPAGRLGGLVCWENYMPLARYALYAGGVQLYLAPTWDAGETWLATMRHIAAEGRCWVLGAGMALRGQDAAPDLPGRDQLYPDPDAWLNPGDSAVVAPGGRIVAGPLHEGVGLLVADCDPAAATAAHRTLDVAGHYARPDVFQLTVDRHRRPLLEVDDAARAGERPLAGGSPPVGEPPR